MAMIGGKLVLFDAASYAAFIECCCSTPCCPTSCCDCCDEYDVTIGSGSICCVDPWGYVWQYSWSSQSFDCPTSGSCGWATGIINTIAYHLKLYSGGTCEAPTGLVSEGDAFFSQAQVALYCAAGQWTIILDIGTEACIQGTIASWTKDITPCPNGSYTGGASVANGSPCSPICCPTNCSTCPTTFTISVVDTAKPWCNGTFTLTRSGTSCSWGDGAPNYNYLGCTGNHWEFNHAYPCSTVYDLGLNTTRCPNTGTFVIGTATLIVS